MAATVPSKTLRNLTVDEIAVGDTATLTRTLTATDIQLFAIVSGDTNPLHIDGAYADQAVFHGVVAHGIWGASLISALLGTRLPGPGTVYLEQSLRFRRPVHIGDALTVSITVTSLEASSRRVCLICRAVNQKSELVLEGEATVLAPSTHIEARQIVLPEVRLVEHGRSELLDRARALGAIRVAVVHPCDENSLSGALQAREAGLIDPILVGPRARIEGVAQTFKLDLGATPIEDVPHSHAAANAGVALAAAHKVDALMKGSLHTDELMTEVVSAHGGLRTGRRMSHCFLMHSPAYPRPFIITDAAINIAPTLEVKADIIRNAIALAETIGVPNPRVAILAAVETVSPNMPATLDAAALCKMADRGQLGNAIVDGPLAFDNAVSAASALIKGIQSPVAGRADILVVPDLESGNILAKQLEYLGGASSAGIALGAQVPIILTSRADPIESRLASCALAVLVAHHIRAAT